VEDDVPYYGHVNKLIIYLSKFYCLLVIYVKN